jgi:hypothetical protein
LPAVAGKAAEAGIRIVADRSGGDVCLPNIGPRQRRVRLIAGVVLIALASFGAVLLLTSEAPRPWRAIIFPVVMFAAVCLLQVQAKTCIALAARGERNLDAGSERVADERELTASRASARRFVSRALLIALLAT